jgi:protein transport protein SEC61 subunit gamma and related proteins
MAVNHIVVADKREFVQISRAIGIGFVIMGAIGYFVKLGELPYLSTYTYLIANHSQPLVHIPVNNILVGGA